MTWRRSSRCIGAHRTRRCGAPRKPRGGTAARVDDGLEALIVPSLRPDPHIEELPAAHELFADGGTDLDERGAFADQLSRDAERGKLDGLSRVLSFGTSGVWRF